MTNAKELKKILEVIKKTVEINGELKELRNLYEELLTLEQSGEVVEKVSDQSEMFQVFLRDFDKLVRIIEDLEDRGVEYIELVLPTRTGAELKETKYLEYIFGKDEQRN